MVQERYKILKAEYDFELEDKVNEEIAEGWEPLGGVCVIVKPNFHQIFYQAMIKKPR